MNRFYVAQAISGGEALITDPGQVHHLRNVLRLKPGDQVELFDGAGSECTGTVLEISRAQARLAVQSRKSPLAGRTRIAVACALPRKDVMDEIVDKLTQLGVDEIVPLKTERVVTRLKDPVAIASRAGRWLRIAQSAAQQSHRGRLPVIAPLTDLTALVSRAGEFDLKVMPTLCGETKSLRDILAGNRPSSVLVVIGPEGDFTAGEVAAAVRAGCVPVSLGRLVMRVSTAAIAAVSYLRLALD